MGVMDKLRIGIIGCGGIAEGKHMPALSKLDCIEMTAFCDIYREKAEKAAGKYGIPGAGIYEDYRELLEDKTIDVVHICTPNRSHGHITVDALESGKHVMCEKPMAKTVEDARKMAETAGRTGKKLTIGYQGRHNREAVYLNKACRNGDLGEIYFAKAHALRRRAVPTWGVFLNEYEQGGGPLIDIGTHALDLTLWMMDNYKPKAVMGATFRKLADQKDTGNAWGDWDPDEFTVEDAAFGFVTMQDGALIILESSWALNTLQTGEAKTTLCGTKGGADMLNGLRINGVSYGSPYITTPDLDSSGVAYFEGKKESAADREARLWIECVLNDTDPIVKPGEALVVTEILDAIYRSAKSGKAVYFD